MPEFTIAVEFSMMGEYKVKADTLEEAKQKVLDAAPPADGLPKDATYIDSSMTINDDVTAELNLPHGGSHAPDCPYITSPAGECLCWRSDPEQNPVK